MTAGAPTVYFIDDSATMREVIKIAFRRENIDVIACHDGATALAQMEEVAPDVVISDVIMPDKDGYQVCEHIKQHARLGKTPVILMSGVVNRAVAERAFGVKADELIRKPFQPQDLIARVRHLLNPRAPIVPPVAAITASAALSSIFSTPVTETLATPKAAVLSAGNGNPPAATAPRSAATAAKLVVPATNGGNGGNGGSLEVQKLKVEVLRLEGLVRKLQSELEAEREYARALEEHVKTLQEAE
jgi:CheY-like chemotaxis protein